MITVSDKARDYLLKKGGTVQILYFNRMAVC
ncbi:MAG: hypothetical protein H6Q72_3525 [Firmicutes bacterium]|nr:hypothetical protein [Bacillota bacterium]